VRAQALGAQDQFLDLGREHVDAADDHHVVGPAGDLFHAPHAARRAGQQAGQVAGAVADDRQRLLGQRGEHQFALLAVGQHFAGLRVDDLGVEVIFPDVQAVLGFHALLRNAGANHFGQAVDIDGVHVESVLDFLAHGVGPRLGTEDADLQRAFARVEPLFAELIQYGQHVAGGDHDDLGLEVGDQLHLALGHAAGDGDDADRPSRSAP
jgi:hypothetical protein